jgi:hypothetical protein
MKLPAHIFHLAEAANWPSIQRHGLLSTSGLLDLAGIWGTERDRFERQHRPVHTELPNGVQIRDQKPMPPQALAQCVVGMSSEDWYRAVNAKVFFWLDPARVDRQRGACGRRPQIVLIVDTQRLLARYAMHISLSPINTGHARRKPVMRGQSTFVPYGVWLESAWSAEASGLNTRVRARSHRPVELTVHEAVPDIMDMVVHVCRLEPGEPFRGLPS